MASVEKRIAVSFGGYAASALLLGFFAVHTLRNDPGTFVVIAVILVLAVVLDLVGKRAWDRPAGVAS
jgi:cell division protein FtsW (lipid II flippase)